MSEQTPKEIGRECRFVVHIPENFRKGTPDVHVIKEQIHYEDGSTKPYVRLVRDYKRPFYVTKKTKRYHKQKKEWEDIENLIKLESTQSKLRESVAKALEMGWSKDHLRKLANSPYLYGTDIASSSLIKKAYMDKYPTLQTPYSVATFDIETDVINGTEDPIMATVIFKNQIQISVVKSFIEGLSFPEERFFKAIDKYIKEYVEKHNMKITLHIAEDTVDCIRTSFKFIHQCQPDFLSIWNMDYDIPKVIGTLEKYGINPAEVLCDPNIPEPLRVCNYKQGPKKKVTASGKVMPIKPAAQWHTLVLTASFYVIDAMCSYKHIRLGEQEESSYSLDAILEKKLGIRKLSFKEADGYHGLKKHQFMQKNFKIEYMVYNVFDCLSMIELDQKTNDIAYTLPAFSGTSDFANFKSQPKRIIDALYFYGLENGVVLASAGESEKTIQVPDEVAEYDGVDDDTEDDEEQEEKEEELTTLDLRGWICTLPAHMSVLGLSVILEDENLKTNIRAFVYDSDMVSSYPSCTSVANVSKSTTKKEMIRVQGIEESLFRYQNMNLLQGPVNALEYCQNMFSMPKPEELLKAFNERNRNA